MTDEQFNSLETKLNDVLELLKAKSSATSTDKRSENASENDKTPPKKASKELTGIVRWAEIKQGRRGEFCVFKLFDSEDGVVACQIWDTGHVQIPIDGARVRVSGNYSEFKGFSNFTVRSLLVLEMPPEESKAGAEAGNGSELPSEDDEVPF